jgi:hypothetical protein
MSRCAWLTADSTTGEEFLEGGNKPAASASSVDVETKPFREMAAARS